MALFIRNFACALQKFDSRFPFSVGQVNIVSGYYVSAKRKVGDEHDTILRHALNGDADKAVETLLSHYHQTGKLLSEFLRNQEH